MSISLQDVPYRRDLKEINLVQALNYLTKCSLHVWETRPSPLYRYPDKVRGVNRFSQPYNLPTLAYLASEIVANARGEKDFGLEELNAGIEFINSHSTIEQDFKKTDDTFRGIQILLATAYPQVAIADGPRIINRFGRYLLLYGEIGSGSGTGSMPKFITQFPDFKSGLQISEFMLMGMVAFALAWKEQGRIKTVDLPDFKVGSILITKDKVNRFLRTVSTGPDTFKNKMIRTVSEKWHMHTLTNPLLRHPVIKVDETHLVPVPQLLVDRCGEGIYEDFREVLDSSQFQQFSEDLGQTFAKYIHHLVRKTSPTWQIWIDIPYNGLRTCDILILDGNDLVLVECKTSRMDKITKTWMSKSKYNWELEAAIDGVEAIVSQDCPTLEKGIVGYQWIRHQ